MPSQLSHLTDMLPAPGQGALAVQCRADEARPGPTVGG